MVNRKIILAALFFICCSFANQQARKIAIVYIGDSITYGAGLDHKENDAPPAIASQIIKKKLAGDVVFSNQGRSGFTTVNFLPSSGNKSWMQVLEAAKALQKDQSNELVFSVMLGTNDSAEEGPKGAPVAPEAYRKNMQVLTDSLLRIFPESKIIIHQPIWYSTNTYNGSRYLAGGLERLQQYFSQITALVKENAKLHPGHVFLGDQSAFKAFKKHPKELMRAENGHMGVFYLHPNEKGAAMLGDYWAKAIQKIL